MRSTAVARFREQYGCRPDFRFHGGKTVRETLAELDAKGPDLLNASWFKVPDCTSCGNDVDAVIVFEREQESVALCRCCLFAALALVEAKP